MDGKVIFEGTSKKGRPYIIRYPKDGDAEAMCDYINAVSQERTYISFQGEEQSLEEEEKFLNDQLKRIREKTGVLLLVVIDNNVVGMSGIEMSGRISKHEGLFGISIANAFRGEGIGKKLMHFVLNEAEKNISQLRIITLSVFGNNPFATTIYETFGFKEYGRLPKGVLHRGEYVDHVYMYKFIGDFNNDHH